LAGISIGRQKSLEKQDVTFPTSLRRFRRQTVARNKREDRAMMRKMIFAGAACLAIVVGAPNAFAIGGGPMAPWASPYAILEPQTVMPEIVVPQAVIEGRSAFEQKPVHCRGDGDCERRTKGDHGATSPEQ
jgi:hypothetical protein